MIPTWTAAEPWPGHTTELLLVGPPGTGKTTTVLQHYVWPMLDQDLPLLVTSYSRAAASELRERTGRRLDADPDTWRESLSTIHSEAARRCRALRLQYGAKGAPPVRDDGEIGPAERLAADEGESALKAWDLTRQLYPADIGRPPRERLARLLYGRDLDVADAEIRRDLDGRYDPETGRLVRPDFTTLLELALTDGSDRHLALLAVDEAQDTTPLQWALVDRWARTADRLLVVGDPDQAIYGWAGADGRRLLRWLEDGRPARLLSQSWRVPRAAHAIARRVVLQVHPRVDAPYLPADRDGRVVEVVDAADATRRAGQATSCLYLSRTVAGCSQAVADLLDADLPHIAERGSPRLLGTVDKPSTAFRQMRCLFTLVSATGWPDHADMRALVGALRSGGPALGGRGAKGALVALCAHTRSCPPREALEQAGLQLGALVRAWAEADEAWLRDATLASQCSVADLLRLGRWYVRHGGGDGVYEVADRIHVTTCHGSKGREAPLVILDARARWHRAWRRDGTREEQSEDRRVAYVGLTRTHDEMILIRSDRTESTVGRGAGDWLDQVGL